MSIFFWKKDENTMNPMVQASVGAIVRWGLGLATGHFLSTAMSEGDLKDVAAAITAVILLVWSLSQKYHARQVLVTSLASGPMTEQTAKALVANPDVSTPPVTTPANQVPTS